MTDTLALASLATKVSNVYDENGNQMMSEHLEVEVNLDLIFRQLKWEPMPVAPEAFWACQQTFTKDAVQVHRGLQVTTKKGNLETVVATEDPEKVLRQLVNADRIGIHWSDNLKSPKRFSSWREMYCECKTCSPYNWSERHIRSLILNERSLKVQGVWACTAGCENCQAEKEKYLAGCRCNTCLTHGPRSCRSYCNAKSPCQKWKTVSKKDIEAHTDENYQMPVAVIVHGETDIESTLLEGDKDYYDYKEKHGIFGYYDEQEITLRYTSPVHVLGVDIKCAHYEKTWKSDFTVTV